MKTEHEDRSTARGVETGQNRPAVQAGPPPRRITAPQPPLPFICRRLHKIEVSAMIEKVPRVKVSVPVLPPYFVRAGRGRGPEVAAVLAPSATWACPKHVVLASGAPVAVEDPLRILIWILGLVDSCVCGSWADDGLELIASPRTRRYRHQRIV